MEKDRAVKGYIRKLLLAPFITATLVGVCFVAALLTDQLAALIVGILFAAVMVFCLIWYMVQRRRAYERIIGFSNIISENAALAASQLPLPAIIAEHGGRILWTNESFNRIFSSNSSDLNEVFEGNELVLPEGSGQTEFVISKNGRSYCVYSSGFEGEEELVSMYFVDDTDRILANKRAEEQKTVLSEIYIDNYDEVMGSVEPVRQSLLTAIIERRLTKYFGNYNGILHKLEKDKYRATLLKRGLDEIEKNRFSILEEIKGVNVGNTVAPTLSIGVGVDGDDLTEDSGYCRMAMDLCLGRGGDQAIVRTPEDTRYYGGKSHGQEKYTRVKARVKAQALKELFMTKDQILVMGHKLPDIDAIGSAMGIYRVARSMAKKVHIVLEEEMSSVRPMTERIRKNSEYPADLFVSGADALEMLDDNTAVVVVDVNKPSYTECPELVMRSGCIVVLDHHRQGEEAINTATLSYIEPYASSASEMVAEILQYLMVTIKLTVEEAEAMYAGIVVDTDNFRNKTGVRTFEAAAFLRRNGADMARVRKLFREPMQDYQAKAETIRNVEIFSNHFAFGVCEADGLDSPPIVAAQAANNLLDVEGVRASIVFTKYHGKVYISARSIDEVNVQLIMERLGGGGHLSIAGAQLPDCGIDEAITLVKETIMQMKKEGAI